MPPKLIKITLFCLLILGISLLIGLFFIPIIQLPGSNERLPVYRSLPVCQTPLDLCYGLRLGFQIILIIAAISLGSCLIGVLLLITNAFYKMYKEQNGWSTWKNPASVSNEIRIPNQIVNKTNRDKKKTSIAFVLVLIFAILFVYSFSSNYTLKSDYSAAQAGLQNAQNEITSLQSQVAILKAENARLTMELFRYKQNYGAVYSGVQPPYLKANGLPITLMRKSGVKDPTWQQLLDLLSKDGTDQLSYTPSFQCGDFSEMLFHTAEQNGIKAGFVAIRFNDGSEGHALNVFKTIDKGLVYIDDTGVNFFKTIPISLTREEAVKRLRNDRIAYVQIGKPLGLISVGTKYGLKYSDYEQWQQDVQAFNEALNHYNFEVTVYNADVTAYNNANNPALTWMRNNIITRENQLKLEEIQLKTQLNQLGELWEPMGTVESVEIYW